MHGRLRSVLATLVGTGMLAGLLGFAPVAHAATTPPPFEPDPGARGCLNFYDSNSNPSTAPPTPANLQNSPNPLYVGGADATIADMLTAMPPQGNIDDGAYQ